MGQRRFSKGDELFDFGRLQSAAGGEKLHAVSVAGQMAGGDHNGTVALGMRGDGGHKHSGRGGHAAIYDKNAAVLQGF